MEAIKWHLVAREEQERQKEGQDARIFIKGLCHVRSIEENLITILISKNLSNISHKPSVV